MNWYKKSKISKRATTDKMLKFASIKSVNFAEDNEVPALNQDANYFHVFDIQRYVFDSYAAKTSISVYSKEARRKINQQNGGNYFSLRSFSPVGGRNARLRAARS